MIFDLGVRKYQKLLTPGLAYFIFIFSTIQ